MKLCCTSESFHRLIKSSEMPLPQWIPYAADTLGLRYLEIEDKHLAGGDALIETVRRNFRIFDQGRP